MYIQSAIGFHPLKRIFNYLDFLLVLDVVLGIEVDLLLFVGIPRLSLRTKPVPLLVDFSILTLLV